MASNYLNPSLFSLGIDSLENSYIGWILVGKRSGSEQSSLNSKNLPSDDGNIAGLMAPVKVTKSFIAEEDGRTVVFGNIGYFMDSNSVSEEKDIIIPNETTLLASNPSSNLSSFNIGVESGYSGSTKLFVNLESTTSTILPPNVGSDSKDTIFINIGPDTGKLLLVKYTGVVNDSNVESFLHHQTPETPLGELRNEYGTDSIFSPEEGNESQWINKYIDKVLFTYDVNPSNGNYCNDWNYTGFSVGKIEVVLSGLNN